MKTTDVLYYAITAGTLAALVVSHDTRVEVTALATFLLAHAFWIKS